MTIVKYVSKINNDIVNQLSIFQNTNTRRTTCGKNNETNNYVYISRISVYNNTGQTMQIYSQYCLEERKGKQRILVETYKAKILLTVKMKKNSPGRSEQIL